MASEDTKKWKPKLLSSSLPLEFDIAKTLVTHGYSVESDFSYMRRVEAHDVEFSVDIRAAWQSEPPKTSKRGCPFDLLVECKHRTRSSAWLFAPKPSGLSVPEYELLRGIDDFSPWFLLDSEWLTKDSWLPITYKGVEIDRSSGHVEASEIRHGLLQLLFAVPSLLRSRIEVPATSFAVIENMPLLFSCVLVTNAELFIASEALSPKSVEAASDISEVAESVQCLVVQAAVGRDFFEHAQRQFQSLSSVVARKGIRAAEKHRRADGVDDWNLPASLANRLATAGDEIESLVNVSNVIVCHASHFGDLVASLAAIANRVSRNAVQHRPEYIKRFE